MHPYHQRWRECLGDTPDPNLADEVFHDLIRRYSERHRAYHNFDHIVACLMHFDVVKGSLGDPRAVELAIWFHDAIYKPTSSSNEEESADLASAQLAQLGTVPSLIETVHALVMVTKHLSEPRNTDEAYLLDIDLAILGAEEGVFAEYGKNVRKEYKWVPGFVYRRERAKVLQGFLAHDRIYRTDYFHERLEADARVNLARALTKLR